MKEMVLELTPHDIKVGDKCSNKAANVTEDTLFIVDNLPVGFYLKSVESAMKQLLGDRILACPQYIKRILRSNL